MARRLMSRAQEREEFVSIMATEGVPLDVARLLMRASSSLHRIAELACSSEAADRDRVPCPGDYAPMMCLCRDCGSWDEEAHTADLTDPTRTPNPASWHGKVPRIAVQEAQIRARVTKLCKEHKLVPRFGGDPRGAVLVVKVPSGRTNDWGQTGVVVP